MTCVGIIESNGDEFKFGLRLKKRWNFGPNTRWQIIRLRSRPSLEMGCSIKNSSYLLTKKSWHKLLTTKCFLSHVLYLCKVFFVWIAFCVRCTLCKGFLVQDDFCMKGFLWQLPSWANDIFLAKRFCFFVQIALFSKSVFLCNLYFIFIEKY